MNAKTRMVANSSLVYRYVFEGSAVERLFALNRILDPDASHIVDVIALMVEEMNISAIMIGSSADGAR